MKTETFESIATINLIHITGGQAATPSGLSNELAQRTLKGVAECGKNYGKLTGLGVNGQIGPCIEEQLRRGGRAQELYGNGTGKPGDGLTPGPYPKTQFLGE